ncbi:hypothetical protein V6N12_040006 [Hibiscus sabdariffa]|uniref:Uncharacterized protein n=1 Tax=Hibiscus sabdariffa TaxID=183260 RepID=A0ABR2E620_9ROSI
MTDEGGASGGKKDKKAEMDDCDWLTGDLVVSFRFSLTPIPISSEILDPTVAWCVEEEEKLHRAAELVHHKSEGC